MLHGKCMSLPWSTYMLSTGFWFVVGAILVVTSEIELFVVPLVRGKIIIPCVVEGVKGECACACGYEYWVNYLHFIDRCTGSLIFRSLVILFVVWHANFFKLSSAFTERMYRSPVLDVTKYLPAKWYTHTKQKCINAYIQTEWTIW